MAKVTKLVALAAAAVIVSHCGSGTPTMPDPPTGQSTSPSSPEPPTPTPPPTQNKRVGVIGCSNSRLVNEAYLAVSTRDVTWEAAQAGDTLRRWASDPPWRTFDSQLSRYGATAIWYPGICIHPGEYATVDQAWADFVAFHAKLRQRTQAPLWVNPYMGAQPNCARDDQTLQTAVVQRAVSLGYALYSTPDIPPASNPTTDNCHFNASASRNVGQAAVQFLDR